MPGYNERKITAAFTLTACLVLMELLHYNNQEDSSYKIHGTGSPHTMVIADLFNTLAEISHALPLEIILILKVMFPLLLLHLLDLELELVVIRNPNQFFTPNEFSPYLKPYILRQQEKQSQRRPYQEQLDQLQLTEAEQVKFAPYVDFITATAIEIPVKLYRNTYDLDTLLNLNPLKDPITNLPFVFRDIQPLPEIAEEIESLIKEFYQARESVRP